jgi:peroxiredoxin
MRLIFSLLLTLTLISCNKESNNYTLTGEAPGFADGTQVFVYTLENKQPKVIDTLTITGEKFSESYPKNDGISLNFLRVDGVNGTVLYFPESTDLKATIYKDSIGASRVTGGEQNKVYNAFATKIKDYKSKNEAIMERFRKASEAKDTATIAELQSENLNLSNEEIEYKKQFLKDNNNSLFSVMLLSDMLNRKDRQGKPEISAAEAKKVIDGLDPKLASSIYVKDIEKMISSMKKADVGTAAPEFSAPTPDGNTMALKDALGKYTIIDFWASWCKPCRMENPNVVKVYNQYHDKGLNIISVSLDKKGQKDKWIKAIKDDNMDWYHVSNLQFWSDPIAKMYSVRSIPATFLLDENGTIIAKNLRGDALKNKIASLLDK